MTRVQGETTAANIIQQTPIKSKGAEQGDNVPAKQLIARVQALTGQIKEKQKDVQKESDKIQELLDNKDLDSSDVKQLNRIVNSLKEQVAELSDKLHEVLNALGGTTTIGGGDDTTTDNDNVTSGGPTMVVTFGYTGAAEEALNELQVQLMELQRLQRQVNNAILDSQRGKDGQMGTIAAIAKAATNSADADAECDRLQMGQDIAQGITSAASLGHSAYRNNKFQTELNNPDPEVGAATRLNNAKAFQDKLSETQQAQAAIGNRPRLPKLTPEEQVKLRDLSEGSGSYKLEGTRTERRVMSHIAADDDLRAKTRENVAREVHNAELAKNTAYTSHQSTMQNWNMGFDIAKQAEAATFTGIQADVKQAQKGPAEALKGLAQYSNDQQSQAVSAGSQNAQNIDQQSLQLNQAKEKVNSQSQ
jgi:hypothetical protein